MDLLSERLSAGDKALSPATRRIAEYILRNRLAVVAKSAQELAQATGTSDATVVRSVQALGFGGLAQLRQVIVESLSARATPAEAMRQTLDDAGSSADTAIRAVIATHVESIRALTGDAARRKMVAATRVLYPCARIVLFGIGPSAGIAEYMCRLLTRSGRPSLALGATGNDFADRLLALQPGDGLLVMAYGRRYREVEVLFDEANRIGVPIVLVTDTLDRHFGGRVAAVVSARRGRRDQVALHTGTLAVMEAIALALAATDRAGSIQTLERLADLRRRIQAHAPAE